MYAKDNSITSSGVFNNRSSGIRNTRESSTIMIVIPAFASARTKRCASFAGQLKSPLLPDSI